jgi:N-acetylmuramoyl-L-alanine amidase
MLKKFTFFCQEPFMNKFSFSFFLTGLIIILLMPVMQANPQINIVYPNKTARINAPSTYFIGNTTPGSNLTINNTPVKLHEGGIFVKVMPLKSGTNSFKLRSVKGNAVKEDTYTVLVPFPETSLPQWPLNIAMNTITPKNTVIYKPGDIVNVRFKGSPGKKASFSIGNNATIPMTELPPEINNVKQMVLGVVYGLPQAPVKGIYNGVYTIKPEDKFQNAPLKIHLSDGHGTTKSQLATTRVTTWHPYENPRVAEVTHDKATVRTGPGDARLAPLPAGTRLHLTGYEDGYYKFKLAGDLEGYISQNQLKLLPVGTPVPFSEIRTVNLQHIYNSTLVRIPVTERIPFSVDQSADQKKLSITLYGAKADTDIIRYDAKDDYLQQIKWSQPANNVYVLDFLFSKDQQWGYDIYYVGEKIKGNLALVIQIKYPPRVESDNPLNGRIIVIDPGHGGYEKGSVGPGEIPEKQINLEISNKIVDLLQQEGAKAYLTRYTDKAVAIYDRPDFAASKNADILISLHNNAIPDGRDPNIEHGSSTYYYHPMAMPLARSIHNNMLTDLGLPDFGLYYDNLALTREHRMPSVLVEIAFMINPQEYILLKTEAFQEKSANAIVKGIREFFATSIQ